MKGGWASTFTQEWPAPSQTHQLSYTVAFLNGDVDSGFGDTLINYRYQASEEGPGRVGLLTTREPGPSDRQSRQGPR